ncbi:OPT oligopeptide transporter domain-containing protein [Trichoderma longibrachiatum]|uniref:OPT-domain-containing protein n=1 Tax=Trichoderma longibrachiatum ATCC 18648 TaxID=983965 RepID=A0A2T4BSA1_TRILO|nr:OPT-domain-containing protein [Trichoderma longibrachiatum ATCC 18648]
MSAEEPCIDKSPEEGNSPQEKAFEEKSGLPTTVHAAEDSENKFTEKLGDISNSTAPLNDIEYVMDKIETLSVEECKDIIRDLLKHHEYDYNFSESQRKKLAALIDGPSENQGAEEWELELKTEAAINKFFSPYPEVRAITTPTDDVNIPCETIRAHLLGYMWAVIAQFTNSLFNSRFPSITLGSSVAQILLYPCGLFLAWVLPDWGFTIRGQRVSLNPGPWTYKEQMLSTIIIDVGLTSAYCFWNIQTQTVYYQDKWLTPGYGILLLLSTQLMGLGFSGLLRRFVVYPVEAIWPNILPTVALNRALLVPEKTETVHGWRLSRYKFFFIFFSGMFVYFWLPDFIFPALSYFAWMTWIAPNNFNLNIITGSTNGLGFNPISTFDWNVLSAYSYPLAYPFFAFFQQFLGTLLAGLIIIALYYTNTNWSAYLPINSSGIFDNTGNSYNITRVIGAGTGILDENAYEQYSPAFYSAGNLVVYGAFFAFYPLTMVFIILDAWRPLLKAYKSMANAAISSTKKILTGLKNTALSLARGDVQGAGRHLRSINDESSIYDGFDDPLTNLMRSYPEVPDWWFLIIALVAFIFAIIIVTHWPQLNTPVWTVFFVIGLNLVFLIPMSYLYSISGTTEGLNVVTELIIGYALPGHPEALMFVKAFGYNINGQADNYISDQKMGFYAKVPPRAMYRGQVLSAIITAFVAYGVVQFADTQIPGICTPDQVSSFNCENGSQVYFSASVVWGAIGPKRIFSQIYPTIKYTFLLGFLLALLWWGLKRFGSYIRAASQAALPAYIHRPIDIAVFTPISWLKHVHPSLVFNGMLQWAPLNLTYFTGGLYFSFAFMYYLRRYKTSWWEKYNYVLSAALTGGVAFSGIIIFFAVQYHPKNISWWGVDVLGQTIDGGAGQQTLLTQLPAKGYFGPDTWH